MGDPRYLINHLQLGRIATYDWSNQKVLDRMMLYERRIESSVVKLMKELKRFQVIRQIELENAEEQFETSPRLRSGQAPSLRDSLEGRPTAEAATQSNSPCLRDEASRQSTRTIPKAYGFEAATLGAEKNGDLKKQSQFVPGQNGATSYVKGDYDRKPAGGDKENKANLSLRERSQFQDADSDSVFEFKEKCLQHERLDVQKT